MIAWTLLLLVVVFGLPFAFGLGVVTTILQLPEDALRGREE